MNAKLGAVYLLFFLLAAFALLYHLDHRPLWSDEAETALLGLHITQLGLPKAGDGKNSIWSTTGGRLRVGGVTAAPVNENDVWIWTPWLDEYLVAGSFALLGRSTRSARLPFALVALAAAGLLARFAWKVSGRHELALVTLALFVTSVPVLLHARQCRYYAIAILGQVWLLEAYRTLLAGRRASGVVQMALALAIQFYTNYAFAAANVLGLVLATLGLARRHRGLLLPVGGALAGLAILAAPWLWYAKPWSQGSALAFSNFGNKLFFYYLPALHFHVVPWVLFPFALICWLVSRSEFASVTSECKSMLLVIGVLILAQLFVVGLTPTPAAVAHTGPPLGYFRYLLPVVVMLYFVAAVLLVHGVPWRPVRYALLATLLVSNALGIATLYPLRGDRRFAWTLPIYLAEICVPYEDQVTVVAGYLNRHADPSDVVYVTGLALPVMFHTPLKVLDSRLDSPHAPVRPTWLVLWSWPENFQTLPRNVLFRYQQVPLDAPNAPLGGNQPDPDLHQPFTSPDRVEVFLYRKRAGVD